MTMYVSYITSVYELTNHNVPKKYNLKINAYFFLMHKSFEPSSLWLFVWTTNLLSL